MPEDKSSSNSQPKTAEQKPIVKRDSEGIKPVKTEPPKPPKK